MSEENNERTPRSNQPRQPHNLQGLLRFAVEATRSEDAPSDGNSMAPMDPERRRFLEEALNSMTVNVIEELELAAKTLTSSTTTESQQTDAIDTILDYVDNIDTANDFCKIGGLEIILPCMTQSPYASVRSACAILVAELAQNNPFCQKQLLDLNALPKLVNLLSDSSTSTSAIRGFSAMVRGYEPCCAAFIEMGGLECILGCLQKSDEEKLVVRSLFLLCALSSEYRGVRDEFVKLKAVEPVLELLEQSATAAIATSSAASTGANNGGGCTEFDVRLEAALSTLNVLTENVEAASHCRESHLNLQTTLTNIIGASRGRFECQEIVEFSQCLLFKLFNATNENNADR